MRLATLLLAAAALPPLPAQERLEVDGPEPATVRLGDVARVLLRIEGRSADPRPPVLPKVPDLQLELSPPTRSSQTFFDGRTMTERVGVQYQLTLRPLREGSFVVPPFAIWTGTKEQSTRELRIEVRKDLRGEDLGYVEVSVEPTRVYVHEPIRIRVDLGVQEGLRLVEGYYPGTRQQCYDLELQASWLERFAGAEPMAAQAPRADHYILGNGQPLYAQIESGHVRGGERWQRFVVERSYLPTRLGRIELPAPLLRYHVLRREGSRDIFGGVRGRQSDNLYAYGEPVTIEVLPIPERGRPDPYYGAVGRFTLEAACDRTSLRVGESLQLTLTVRGRGNLEFLRLPELGDLPGLHKLGQKEARTAEQVAVTYDLTPLSADVRSIPAIEWNYFDTTPGVEAFAVVRTEPIALRVEPLANGAGLAPLPDAAPAPVTPGVDDIFDLPAFDGSAAVPSPSPAWFGWVAVLLPWALVALMRGAFVVWRRRVQDVRGQRARGAARRCEQALKAGAAPGDALAGYLADRLDVPDAAVVRPDLAQQLEAAGLEPALARDVAECLDAGLAARYGGGAGPGADRVRTLLAALERARFGVRSLCLLLLPLLAGAALRAQDPAAAAVAHYRARDFAAAEAAFAEAFLATGDYRHWQARGNCFYRLGRLPEALWAYETARLARPRDPELLANVALVRRQLGVERTAAGFTAELIDLRDRLSPAERAWLLALLMAGAAGCLVLGWRRVGARWIGALLLLPGTVVAVEVVWLLPHRPGVAIALQKVGLTSEPGGGATVATVRPGVALAVLGGGDGAFVRVDAGERTGFAPREQLGLVR